VGATEIAVVALVVGFSLMAVLAALISLLVPWHAYRRGHGFVSWYVLQLLSFNPVYPLILVAILPNKARTRLRDRFAQELDEKLEEAGLPVAPRIGPAGAIDRSIGDAATAASIGEVPTADPRLRSLGEEETRP
jgi:hypothetical protein